MVSPFLKISSVSDIGILDELLEKLCLMTPSMVGLSKNVSLALEGL